MSTPLDAEVRDERMFPRLEPAQIERMGRCGERRWARAGELIQEQGERSTHIFLVLSGALEVVRPGPGGAEERLRIHGPGEFSGELDVLSGRPSLVRARMREDGELVALDRGHLRQLVQLDPQVSDVLLRAFLLRRTQLISRHLGDVVLVGSKHSQATLGLREFLTRNGHPHSYVDVEEDPAVQQLLDRFHVGVADIPVVICRGQSVLRNPSHEELAELLGLRVPVSPGTLRDVIVVGAGPAGLAVAVYAASEGLDVLVLETEAPGGQAGASSKIENYLGFPTGISGEALAGRAFTQLVKFGAEISIAQPALSLRCDGGRLGVLVDGERTVHARAVVVASGARYHKPDLAGLERFENSGVYYAATQVEAQLCRGEEVVVVGGGNSAGQAAVFLSQQVQKVYVLVRGAGLAESMSRYLIRRIEQCPGIELRTGTELEALEGDRQLEGLRWRHHDTGTVEARPIRRVFIMTGADPSTGWLHGCLTLDDKGFVKTGSDLRSDELRAAGWPLARAPYLVESSRPAVFAVGDVRSGSAKRVAAAVGEGATCVQLLHKVLHE